MKWLQIRMIWWEIFQANRLGFVLGLVGAPLLISVMSIMGDMYPDLVISKKLAKLVFFFSIMYFLVIFSYAEFATESYARGFPRHLLRLPLPTWGLILSPFLFAWIVLYGYVTLGLLWFTQGQLAGLEFLSIAILLAVLVSWIQAISWGLMNSPLKAIVAFVFICSILAVCATALMTSDESRLLHPLFALAIQFVLLVAGLMFSYISVSNDRCGELSSQPWRLSDFNLTFLAMNRPFSSGYAAQNQYERCLFLWLLPSAALLISFIMLVLPSVSTQERAFEVFFIAQSIIVYLSWLSGFALAHSNMGQRNYQMNAFWALRPLSSVKLANSRLRVLAESIVLAFGLLYFFSILGWVIAADFDFLLQKYQQYFSDKDSFESLVLTLGILVLPPWVAWCLSSVSLSFSLWGDKGKVIKATYALIVILMFVLFLINKLGQIETVKMIWTLYAPYILVLPTLLITFFMAWLTDYYRKIASLSQLRKPVKRIVSGWVLFVAMLFLVDMALLQRTLLVMVSINLVLLGTLPFIAAPITLAKNRSQ